MAAVITVEDVKNGYATTVPDSEIQMLIDIVDGADACLDANSIPEATQKALKIYAVRHMLQLQANAGKGSVRSESAPSGASRSYSGYSGGEGLSSTAYGSMLLQLDTTGCVTGILQNTGSVSFMSVGRRACS
jgi:hypothetical protein